VEAKTLVDTGKMIKLQDILKSILEEEKTKRDRCLRIADRKFDKPSAYKSGAVVRCRQGKIWKDIKEEELNEDESLHKWFKRSGPKGKEGGWVDCNAPDGKGGYKACGRKEGEKRSKYPACRPTPVGCKAKGKGKTWGKTK
jgi:predicted metal-dependent phosphoesterase TrpH